MFNIFAKEEKKTRNSRAPLRNQKGNVETIVVEVKITI